MQIPCNQLEDLFRRTAVLRSLKVKIITPIPKKAQSNNKQQVYEFLSDGVNFLPLGKAHVMTYLSPQKQKKPSLWRNFLTNFTTSASGVDAPDLATRLVVRLAAMLQRRGAWEGGVGQGRAQPGHARNGAAAASYLSPPLRARSSLSQLI